MNRSKPFFGLAVAFIVASVAAGVACSSAPTDYAVAGSGPSGGASCSTPNAGCPCDTGSTAACGIEVKGNDDFVWCAEGARSCTAGAWGPCIEDGHLSVHSRTVPLVASGNVSTRGYGAARTCADAGLNACDPYCNVQSDTPTGIDAGGGFSLVDGGLVTTGGCSNGILGPGEECDDGNLTSGDGCSNACDLETGFQCITPGMPCTATNCGNGTREGAEQCDDGNLRPFDGCSPTCQLEPVCVTGGCAAICGDGLKFPGEACDDGNAVSGDGCSSTCTIEADAVCTVVTASLPPSINVPLIVRDFTPGTNPDFEFPYSGPGSLLSGTILNVTQPTLAADQEPAFLATRGTVTSNATFDEWYHDGPNNKVVLSSLTLVKQPDNSYLYNSRLGAPNPVVSFFPIDGQGFGNYGATGHNYHFTSELRYPFTYQGGEVLDFLGDDDLWVFINGRLAVDLGGAHSAVTGSVTLNAATATTLGLTVGNTYRLDVFQAERHTTGSSYKLTLRGFVQAKSYCSLPVDTTFYRDFEAKCPDGFSPKWQLFRWKASVPLLTSIEFRAATSDDPTTFPASPPPAAPATVPIGTATSLNSPPVGPTFWVNDVDAALLPVPVSAHLFAEGNRTRSKAHLRVYMHFNSLGPLSPRLDEWQQQYDCVPSE